MALYFNDCELDTEHHLFRRDGVEVALEPQVFDLLALFAARPGELLSRDQIIAEIWGGRIVSDAAVASRINAVRRAIGDDGQRQDMLKTVPRRGFRFVAKVFDAARPEPCSTTPQSVRITRSPDGARIAYATTGTGPPLLRAGHFLTHLQQDWHSPIWRPLLDRMGAGFTLTRYDQRGTGLSDPAPPALTLEAFVQDLCAVADAAGVTRFPIFAASQGVPVAIAVAARHPERVSALVLYGGYVQGRSVRGGAEGLRVAGAILEMIRQGWGVDGSAFAEAFATLYMPDATREQLQHLAGMQRASATADNAVALRRAIDAFDVSDLLGKVRAPTLVLHARQDAVHPVEQSLALAEGIKGADLRVLEGRNHVPLPHDPCWEEMMIATEDFLARNIGGGT